MRWPSMVSEAGSESATATEASDATSAVAMTNRRLGSAGKRANRFVRIVRIALDDNPLDLTAQSGQQPIFRIGADQLAIAVNGPFALATGDANVGHLRFAGTVDH